MKVVHTLYLRPCHRVTPVVGLVIIGLLLSLLTAASPADIGKGEEIFEQQCAACHTIGGGAAVGPDLKDVTTRRDRKWLTRFIIEPDKMLEANDPIAVALLGEYDNLPMPNMGLSKEDAEDMLAFLGAESSPVKPSPSPAATTPHTAALSSPVAVPPPPSPSPTPATTPGDRVTGKNLFTGLTRLRNGGSPCLACHNVAGLGNLKGGTLAPDLTPVFTKYGDAGTTSILTILPFPTMKPLYDNRPLTPEEVSHLKTFLKQTTVEQSAPITGRMVTYILIGPVVLLLLVQIIWRRRLPGVRKSLLR